MKPPDKTRNGDPKAAATHDPAKDSVALGELVNFLKGQWLRHDVLFRALRNEQDGLAALRFARFVDAIKEVRK